MKIAKGLREIHGDCLQQYGVLKEEVETLLKPNAEKQGWFFLSRLKELESFALKLETGRVSDPSRLEDFLACSIVVPTMAQIEEAEEIVLDFFDLTERRPRKKDVTPKSSSSFEFDDLRLYVARRPAVSGRHPELDGRVFEVQIKTILQHAWTHATHDLIYKSDTVSWRRERIAYQVKAMLEHAEVAISEANVLAETAVLAKSHERTADILDLIQQIKQTWPNERLPVDVKRLAQTIRQIFQTADLNVKRFRDVIEEEKRRFGLLPYDLSPYAFTLQALANFRDIDFQQKFTRPNVRTSVLVHDGMDLPAWMFEDHRRIIRA